MKVRSCDFLLGATRSSQYPNLGLPEIAFLGRSNVGKSSLINALAGRRITRVSRTPGRTQQAHFYGINDKMILVDMPGYGYAKAPARVREELVEIIESYMTATRPLVLTALVVDSRREPSELDMKMNEWLAARDMPVLVVSTKIDKLSRSARSQSLSRSRKLLKRDEIIAFSSETGEGKRGLWQAIEKRIGQ